jgi:mannosyltransferase OCH1-like enzyme
MKNNVYKFIKNNMLFIFIILILFIIYIFNNNYETFDNEGELISYNVFLTWHTKDIPYHMKKNIEQIKNDNPEFNVQLYDDNDNIKFLEENFEIDVVEAYKELVPNSYKSDLFRFAVLYIYGGIYLDVKMYPINNFKLKELVKSEHYVEDNFYDGHPGIYTAVMVIKKGNPLMLDIVNQIVINVKNRDYSQRVLGITGPKLYYEKYQEKKDVYKLPIIDMKHYYDDSGAVIEWNGKKIMTHYKEYRDEQGKVQQTKHYTELFKQHCVFQGEICEIINN